MLPVTPPERDIDAALARASRFFMGTSDVQLAANKLVAKLDELGIPYAICGGLAVFAHGHERMTRDVDVVLTPDGLKKFKEHALGLGWLERFPGSRGVKDMEYKVPIDVLVTGGHPGAGKARGLTFPDPATSSVVLQGKRYLTLPKLIEMKLGSGMSAPDRPRDFDDVIQLIRAQALPESFAEGLHPEVQGKYGELWALAQRPTGEY